MKNQQLNHFWRFVITFALFMKLQGVFLVRSNNILYWQKIIENQSLIHQKV